MSRCVSRSVSRLVSLYGKSGDERFCKWVSKSISRSMSKSVRWLVSL